MSSTTNTSNTSVASLLKKTEHYDKDERYMATSDLCEVLKRSTTSSAAAGASAVAASAAAKDGQRVGWIIILFAYTFVASVLPVWLLLQPRDYVNGHQLFVALGIISLGVLVTNPPVLAPAVNLALTSDAPSWFPLLFITIACGAISGFHSLVATGTTSSTKRPAACAASAFS